MIPTLIIIGADKGGVGKTMLARVLLDYLKERNVKPAVYDTEAEPGVLRRFYSYAKPVDVGQMNGQVEIFDGAAAADKFTVVDLRAGVLSRVLAAMRDAGLLKDIHDGKMRMVVLHVLGSTEASLREIAATASVLKDGGDHVLVKNYATDGQFFEWDKATHDSFFPAGKPMMVIPHLDGMACDAVEKRGQPFAGFIGDTENSSWLRGVVRHWRGLVFKEFDRVKIAG